MEDPLRVYLHDHLAGSGFAIELLETLEREYQNHKTGAFATLILKEVRSDRAVLEEIVAKVGRSSADLKDATAWLAEKASRAKLRHNDPTGIAAFEAIETVSLGIMGKLALWCALEIVEPADSRLAGYNFASLAASARQQFAEVESYRRQLASQSLVVTPASQ